MAIPIIAQKYRWEAALALLLIAAFAAYAIVSVRMHQRFATFGLDLGYFDEALWKISRGKFPYSGIGCIWLLEDHFQPILYAVAQLYKLWNSAGILLVAQAFWTVAAGVPLYLLSNRVTSHKGFSVAVVFSYLFFIGTQFSVLNEFHQITIAPFFIILLYLAVAKRNIALFFFSCLMLLLIKEDLTLFIAAVGIGLMFTRSWRGIGIITAVFGIVAFVLLIYVFMPSWSYKGVYSHLDFGEIGYTPRDILVRMATHPFLTVSSLVYPFIKLRTLFLSFFTFAFLPVFAPVFILVPLIEDFVTRFIYAGPQVTKWALVNHHAAVSAGLLAVCTVFAAAKLSKRSKKNAGRLFSWFGVLLVLSTIVADISAHAPLHSILKRQLYEDEQWMHDMRSVLSHVPMDETVSVAAQNNILPHVAHRNDVYRLPYGLNSQYIVVDLADGPNKYAPLTHAEMSALVEDLVDSARFTIVKEKGEAMLLKRNFKTDVTKSKYYGDTRFCYYSFEER